MDWTAWIQKYAGLAIDRLTRRTIGGYILMAGVTLVCVSLAGLKVGLTHRGAATFDLFLSTDSGLPEVFAVVTFWLGCLLVLLGVVLLIHSFVAQSRKANQRAVVVVEMRGLIDTSDSPLLAAIPKSIPGSRIDASVDVRKYLNEGSIETALNEVATVSRLVRMGRGSRSPSQTLVAVGGVLHVPLLFYTGLLLDDEGRIVHFDWDRSSERWRQLDEVDDGERFETPSGSNEECPEVVLAISASYVVDHEAIARTFGSIPVVEMRLLHPVPNRLWSAEKQRRLSSQFVEMMASLGNNGAKVVHLVLAASASLTLRLGRAYDSRNMPELRCYQYERNTSPPYPWAVVFGSGGDGRIVRRSDSGLRD